MPLGSFGSLITPEGLAGLLEDELELLPAVEFKFELPQTCLMPQNCVFFISLVGCYSHSYLSAVKK